MRCLKPGMHAIALCLLLSLLMPPLKGQTPPGFTARSGQNPLKNLTLEELSAIEFTTVSKGSNQAFKTPAAISVLAREDIARSGAMNIPDLLRLLPGVEVAQISSDRWAIGIRGFQGYLSKSVLVLIDGRSVYTPLFAGVYWEMQDTLIEDIERIEVIRGPGGTIWGTNAVNGVINIITRSAKDTRNPLFTAGGGTVEQGFFSARYGGGDVNRAYRVWARGFTRGPQFHRDRGNFDDWRRGEAGFRMDWTPTTADSLTVSGGGYAVEAGSRLAVSTYSPPQIFNVEDNGEYFGQHLLASWQRTLPSGTNFQLRAFFDRTDRRDLNYREIRKTFDIDFLHRIVLGPNDITWGLGMRKSPGHFFQTVPTVNFSPAEQVYSNYSGFVQGSIAVVPNLLTAVIGAKAERNSFSGLQLQPSVRIAWTPSDQHTIWAAVTRAVRTPSRLEDGFDFSALVMPAIPLYVRLVGDGQFEPEELDGYELGYRTYIRQHGFVSITGFYNSYSNLLSVEQAPIFAEDTPGPSHVVIPLHLRNGIVAETAGFEIASIWDLNSWWRMKPSYSYVYLDARRDAGSNDASTVKQLEGDTSGHKVLVQSMFSLPHGLNIDLRYRYVSAVPNQNVPAYSTGDARIAMKISRDMEISLTGVNLFQPHHPEYGGLPGGPVEIRRSTYVKLAWAQ